MRLCLPPGSHRESPWDRKVSPLLCSSVGVTPSFLKYSSVSGSTTSSLASLSLALMWDTTSECRSPSTLIPFTCTGTASQPKPGPQGSSCLPDPSFPKDSFLYSCWDCGIFLSLFLLG